MNRFLALYYHWLDGTEHRREFTHIYAKDLSDRVYAFFNYPKQPYTKS